MSNERETLMLWMEGRPAPGALKFFERSGIPDELIFDAFFEGINTSDPAATPLQVFKDPKNHVDATSSILSFAANRADFHPCTQNPIELAKHFNAFIQAISTFPGFFLTYNEQSSSFQTSTNIDIMIADIKSAYEGVVSVEIQKIIDSISRMANNVISQSHSDGSRVMFVQLGVTRANDNDITISIFYTTLHMRKDMSGKRTYTDQSYTINRMVFKVQNSVLVANADFFAQRIPKVTMDEWLRPLNCPDDSKIKSCFAKHLQAKKN
ncbi:hypothetical protein BGX23_005693 [Mortierella sp. AD031]|nr:hypothetical protein BGX23_005693 [Mortierella sp. AD031]